MSKRLAYWYININNIKNNVEGFLSWLLRMHEVVFYAIDENNTLIILVERHEEELERLKKDAESLGIKIRENE